MREPSAGDTFLARLQDDQITGVRDLPRHEVDRIRAAMVAMRQYHRESQSYEHVRRDFDDLHQYVKGVRELITEHGTSPDLALDIEIEINRRVMALLNSFAAFIDHTRHWLSLRFGASSAELKAFDDARKAEYDGHFAYRLASRLRNYSQHRDLPVGYMRLYGPGMRRRGAVDVVLVCVRDQMLASGFEWKSFREDLAGQPESWNLQQSIESVMPCIDRLRGLAITSVLQETLGYARVIVAVADEVGVELQPVLMTVIDPSPANTRVTVTLLPYCHSREFIRRFGEG